MVVAPLPPTLDATARCTRCQHPVAFRDSAQHGRPVAVHAEPVKVQALLMAADLAAPGAALTEDGAPASLTKQGSTFGYLLHAGACPVLRARRKAGEGSGYAHVDAPGDTEPLTPPRRPALQVPDRGKCSKCPARVLWILTRQSKKISLDPTPYTGVVLTTELARELKGDPVLVRGFNLRGEVVAIREGFMPASPHEAADTVYVTHFATCPEAASFRR